ncbi:MAG: YceD family protein [Chitinivibrionales bacterium]
MLIPVQDIPAGHKEFRLNSVLSGDYADKAGIRGKVACSVAADRLDDEIFIRCSFTTEMELSCSRCMKRYTEEISCEYSGFFKKGDRETPLPEDADGFYTDESDSIDLSKRIYEESMLMRPMKPLCSEECKGIEVEGAEEEEADRIDPRWAKLKELKEKMNSSIDGNKSNQK